MTKPIVVYHVQHKTVKDPGIPVTLTTGGGESYFRAKVRDQIVDGRTLETVVTQVTARLDAEVGVTWTPVIMLHLHREGVRGASDGDPLAAAASLSFERFWVAPVPTPNDGLSDNHRGSWSGKLRAPWEARTPAARWKKSQNFYVGFAGSRYETPQQDGKLLLPQKLIDHSGSNSHLLAYTEATWTALTVIVQRLHETRAQLGRMVSSRESVALLESLGKDLIENRTELLLGAGPSPTK